MAEMPSMEGMDANVDENAIQDCLAVLETYRDKCIENGQYEEAALASTRADQLKQHEEKRRREDLNSQQLAERLEMEEAHMRDLQEFNDIWDKKTIEFEAHAVNMLVTPLAQRHEQEYGEYTDRIKRDTEPRTPRWSRDVLNLRRIKETLAKQKKFGEAAKTAATIDGLEFKELAAWKDTRDRKIKSLQDIFCGKQQLEMGGLMKRIQSGRDEQKHARKNELERLLQRYHNGKTQLESQQKIIQQRVEKYRLSTSAATNASMSGRPGSANRR